MREEEIKANIIKLPDAACTGCSSCANICPTNSISMKKDDNGFLYPHISTETCISCKKCMSSCPVLNPDYDNESSPICYAAIGDNDLRKKSSSGGAFGIIARHILSKGGLVCGARFDEDNITVYHAIIDNEDSLLPLQKSKYVQSEIRSSYRQIKNNLESGKRVLFTGCPCQVAGLKKYLSKIYDELITIDITCHGVPSSEVFKKFTEEISKSELEKSSFREKDIHGWTPSMSLSFSDGTKYYRPSWECPYYKAFLSIMACRKSCGECLFNRLPRQGDITLADFWGIGDTHKHLDDNLGTSLILVNSEKGRKLFSEIKDRFVICEETDINLARPKNWNVFGSSKTHRERDRFLKLLKTHGFSDSLNRINNRWFDVGIISWWYGKNYGSALTGYALHEVIEGLGYDTLMLDWPLEKKPFRPIADSDVRRFAKEHYNISVQRTFSELPGLNNHIEQFVVGSDQLWNYYDSKMTGYYYFLDFVRPYRKKISYATSFGHSEYRAPKEVIRKESELLKSFDHVSVRERDGVRICKDVFKVDSTQVLDPVFLCPKEKYIELISDRICDTPYIFAYILSPSKEIGKKLIALSKKHKEKLIIAVDRQSNHEENIEKMCVSESDCVNPSITEWLNYLYHSSLVVTDSYHGLCFSLIFNKPFFCIKNNKRGLSRFESIAEIINIDDVMLNSINDLKSTKCAFGLNYNLINESLKAEINKSTEWLRRALSSQKVIRESSEMISRYELDNFRSDSKNLGKWRSYADLYKNLFIQNISPEIFKKWFEENNLKTAAIYGNTYPTDAVLDLLSNSSVSIEYIIENECRSPFKTYPRDQEVFPDVDVIIIADLQNKAYIKEKMVKKMPYAVIESVDDIIKGIIKVG